LPAARQRPMALCDSSVRCGSTLGQNGQVQVWTYYSVGRPVILSVTNLRFGPVGHQVEPDHLHL
jgi:hypothetical protein